MRRPRQTSKPKAGRDEPTLAEVAARAGVSPATVRRWVKEGLMPQYEGLWTPAAAAQVRIVGRLRERGHTIEQIRGASESGQLAGYVRAVRSAEGRYTLRQAAREAEIDAELIERIYMCAGPEHADGRRDHRGRPGDAALHRGDPRLRPSRGRVSAARARVRADAGPDRRRRGAAVPHLRARADDARRHARACRWPRRWRG